MARFSAPRGFRCTASKAAGIVGEPSGSHGLDERILVESYHGQVPTIQDLIRRLVG